jgi:glycosyltransferase involved in cell wall biosynthesis
LRVVWVNKSFLDYRIPVYVELNRLLDGKFSIVYSGDYTPDRVQKRIKSLLGEQAIGLRGERIIFRHGDLKSDFANAYSEITYQPGLYQAIKRSNPDVVIGEGFFQWTTAAIIFRILHGIPLIISYERTHHTERNSQWFRTLYRKAVTRLISAMCCNGRLSAEYVNWLGMPGGRIVTGSMAADSERLQRNCEAISVDKRTAIRLSLNLNTPVFLYVGQLVKRKGVFQLLEHWKRLQSYNQLEKGSLVIVGDGPERIPLEKFVKDKALRNVYFLGAVDYDSIVQYYAIADVFVMPTLEDNWSLVVPEAMSCGLPILCSIYNGCWPELVKDDINGYTFNPYNTEETCAILKLFIDHPENVHRMGEASRKIVADFSPANAAKAIFRACHLAANGKTI